MDLNRQGFHALRRVPPLYCSVISYGNDVPVVWSKGDHENTVRMPLEDEDLLSCLCIPYPCGVVITARNNVPAIMREGDRMDKATHVPLRYG